MISRALVTATVRPIAVGPPRQTPQACDSSPLVVRNANLWTRDGVVRNRDVLFRDARVAAIEPSNAKQPDGATTIDGTGHTLLPGLIDLHLHLTIPGGLPVGDRSRTYLQDISGQALLRSGVTSGRLHLATVDDAVRLKGRSADPCAPQPRLQVGGPGLSGAADRDSGNFQGAGSREDAIEDRAISGCRDRLGRDPQRRSIRAGCARGDCHNREEGGDAELMAAGSTPAEIGAALSIRPDTLDYFDCTEAALYPEQILQSMRAQPELVLVPTPGVPFRTVVYFRNAALLGRHENFEFLAPQDVEFVLANAKKDLAGAEATRSERVMDSLPAKFRQLRQLGLPMAVGSDAGSPLHFPAAAIWRELEAWRSLGATHREALVAATEQGARVRRATDVGRLTVGSRADFVLYRGDVEDGPFEMARVLAVTKDGVRYR